MPRTLPWLKDGGVTSPARSRPGKNGTHPAKKPRLADSEANHAVLDPSAPRGSSPIARTPPTSPPPAPPGEEAIHEGYDADDIWMMVEDEFLATAQSYTQHLHYAEYVRLQKQAKEKENQTSRPQSVMAGFVPHHWAAPKKQRRRDSSSEDEEGSISNSTLAGLMDSPRKRPALLLRSATTDRPPLSPSKIRNAAEHMLQARASSSGEGEAVSRIQARIAVSDSETTDDGDLDAPIRPRATLFSTNIDKSSTSLTMARELTSYNSFNSRYKQTNRASASRTSASSSLDKLKLENGISKTGSKLDLHGSGSRRVAEILAERRVKDKSKQTEKLHTTNDDTTTEIPTFLF